MISWLKKLIRLFKPKKHILFEAEYTYSIDPKTNKSVAVFYKKL